MTRMLSARRYSYSWARWNWQEDFRKRRKVRLCQSA